MSESTGLSEPEQPERDADFEARFAQLVKDVEAGRKGAIEEPSAQARMLAAQRREQPPGAARRDGTPSFAEAATKPEKRTPTKRAWPRNAAAFAVVGALTFGAVEAKRHMGAHGTAASSSVDSAPSAASSASAGASADKSAGAGAGSTAGAGADAVSQIPVSRLFPQTVKGAGGTVYTLVTAGPLNNCINSDMVGPTLAGLFAQSNGCVGGEGALYKDAAKDQFNTTVFTLKDPVDVVTILTDLSMDPTDFEVGALVPPAGSGLTQLSATSGIIQQFASSGHYMGVFMAQWADGRASDYGSLQKLLDPLATALSTTIKDASSS